MSFGYDGQFAYYLAVAGREAAPHMGQPAYRSQLMLLPLLARLVSLGNAVAVPWALLGINLVAVAAGVEGIGRMLRHAGQSVSPALAYALWPGAVFAFRTDLHEPLLYALVLLGLLAWQRGRWLAAALLGLAARNRELALLFTAALVLGECLNRRPRRGLVVLLVAALPFVVQQGLLLLTFGSPSWGSPDRRPSAPFAAYFSARDAASLWLESAFIAVPATLALLYAVLRLARGARDAPTLACLLAALLVVLLPPFSGQHVWAAARPALALLVATLALAAQPNRAAQIAATLTPLFWPVLLLGLGSSEFLGLA